jgi:uncharacterized membrane protein (UPF0127 family)
VVLALLSYVAYSFATTPGPVSLPNPPSSFTVDGRTFGITYVASNQSSRESGLMDKRVTNSTTMLFLFPSPGRYSFWMSHVNSSLDIVWLNVTGRAGRVVYILAGAPGCDSSILCPVYQPPVPANWVLEAKGGFCESNGVRVGADIEFG